MSELAPEVKLRDLEMRRHMYLGALAAVDLFAENQGWIEEYRIRLTEIEEEIKCVSAS